MRLTRCARAVVVTARRPLMGRRGGALASDPVVATGGKVLIKSTTTKWRMRLAMRLEVGLIEEVVRRRVGAAVRCGVITGGRVGGDSGYLWELQGRMREVRAAPTRKMVVDWEGLTVGVGGGGEGRQR
jgi:hypothetical protein